MLLMLLWTFLYMTFTERTGRCISVRFRPKSGIDGSEVYTYVCSVLVDTTKQFLEVVRPIYTALSVYASASCSCCRSLLTLGIVHFSL